ncbi:hypothetical protein Tco_0736056 [Tanacetum coccineum]
MWRLPTRVADAREKASIDIGGESHLILRGDRCKLMIMNRGSESRWQGEMPSERAVKSVMSDLIRVIRADKAEGDEDEEMDYTTKEGTDATMTNVQQGNENPEISQVIEDAHVTLSTVLQKAEVPYSSSSRSSDLAAKFLNFLDIPTIEAEIVSPLDVPVHHEVPSQQIPTLLTVSVLVISKSSPVISTVIPQSLQSFTPPPLLSTPIPPLTTKAINSPSTLPDFASVFQFNNRVTTLEQEVELIEYSLSNSNSNSKFDIRSCVHLGIDIDIPRPTSGIRATKGTLHKIEHRSKPFIPPNQIIMSANDNFSLHDDEELSLHDDASLDGSVPASNKGDAPAKPPQIHFQTLNCPFSKKMINNVGNEMEHILSI